MLDMDDKILIDIDDICRDQNKRGIKSSNIIFNSMTTIQFDRNWTFLYHLKREGDHLYSLRLYGCISVTEQCFTADYLKLHQIKMLMTLKAKQKDLSENGALK